MKINKKKSGVYKHESTGLEMNERTVPTTTGPKGKEKDKSDLCERGAGPGLGGLYI